MLNNDVIYYKSVDSLKTVFFATFQLKYKQYKQFKYIRK